MTDQDFYKKTDEYIAKFQNGKERYHKSPTFNRVIQMFVRGVDVYDVVDQLCHIIDDQSNAFAQYVLRDTRPMFIGDNEVSACPQCNARGNEPHEYGCTHK